MSGSVRSGRKRRKNGHSYTSGRGTLFRDSFTSTLYLTFRPYARGRTCSRTSHSSGIPWRQVKPALDLLEVSCVNMLRLSALPSLTCRSALPQETNVLGFHKARTRHWCYRVSYRLLLNYSTVSIQVHE